MSLTKTEFERFMFLFGVTRSERRTIGWLATDELNSCTSNFSGPNTIIKNVVQQLYSYADKNYRILISDYSLLTFITTNDPLRFFDEDRYRQAFDIISLCLSPVH